MQSHFHATDKSIDPDKTMHNTETGTDEICCSSKSPFNHLSLILVCEPFNGSCQHTQTNPWDCWKISPQPQKMDYIIRSHIRTPKICSPSPNTWHKYISMISATLPALLLGLGVPVVAHGNHEEIEAQNAPVDALLWIHIFLQASVWGILFPAGMVLGMTRSRWHVPLQVNTLHVNCDVQ